ncbi:thiopeptide-type bacteriocin biosynthesis protein [Rheinheimera sp. NSM]|uniref:thiopeptide-type bacteriocin biosynthesis protein n=1 Tax=Rheinheimera sp. NSM TaxID=3457884 RepID=UPI004035B807
MWQSYHFFVHDFQCMNHCLKTAATELPSTLLGQLFFIRYWHGGPHLRFRLCQGADASPLLRNLQEYWRQHGQQQVLDPEEYYRPYRKYFDGEQGNILYAAGSIEAIEYQPETARYGGVLGVALCERFFCRDSARTLRQLSVSDVDNERKMFAISMAYAMVAGRLGLNGMALLDVPGITTKDESSLITKRVSQRFYDSKETYHGYYQRFVDGYHQDQYLTGLQQDLRELIYGLQQAGVGAVEDVLHSLLHMSFNRFGVPPFKESTIRYFAYLTLSQWGDNNALKAG